MHGSSIAKEDDVLDILKGYVCTAKSCKAALSVGICKVPMGVVFCPSYIIRFLCSLLFGFFLVCITKSLGNALFERGSDIEACDMFCFQIGTKLVYGWYIFVLQIYDRILKVFYPTVLSTYGMDGL